MTQAVAAESVDTRTELPGRRTRSPRFGTQIGDTHAIAAVAFGQIQRLICRFDQVLELGAGPWNECGAADRHGDMPHLAIVARLR